jgi:hypothetical protein
MALSIANSRAGIVVPIVFIHQIALYLNVEREKSKSIPNANF